jgi:gamma-glutamylcyclotransferase (GGCT)/AIG2-like uncharacterized protein YtfP
MTDNMPIDLFVYGTLLKGQSNHHWLQDAPYLGPDTLANGCLFDMGEYPMLLPGSNSIAGEVYRISANILANLDQLEEHPKVYHRESVILQSGRAAQVYWGKPIWTKERPIIPGGSWRQYSQLH